MVPSSTSAIPLARPFTPNALDAIRDALRGVSQQIPIPLPHLRPNHGAVLIPLCNVDGQPGVLLEVRGKTLRNHPGEVSFPGGKMDEEDPSLQHAALRETQEELGINPDQVDILGSIGSPEMNRRGDMTVWSFVGFVHPSSDIAESALRSDESFPSLDLASIQRTLPTIEVATAFHLPLSALVDPTRRRLDTFGDGKPYWAIAVGDLLRSNYMTTTAVDTVSPDHAAGEASLNGHKEETLEVWGLTGWYLSLLMRIMEICE